MTDNPAPADIEAVGRAVAFYQPDNILDALTIRGSLIGTPLPYKTEPQCKVCQHAERIYLENATHAGYDHSEIVAGLHNPLAFDGSEITWRNIREHFKNGHVPVNKAEIAETLWKSAEEHGISPEEYSATQMAHVEALDLVVNKFLRRLRDPNVQPDISEGLKAVQMMHAIQIEGGGGVFDPNDMYVALSLMMRHIQTVMMEYIPDDYKAAMTDLRHLALADPILRKLIDKAPVEEETASLDHEDEGEEAEVVPEVVAEIVAYIPPSEFVDDDVPDEE